jgi:hypothetical protein
MWCIVAAHGVQGDVDGLAQLRPLSSRTERPVLLLYFVFNLNNLPAFVKASFHVHMVWPMIFAGGLILDISWRIKRVVGTAHAAARLGNFLFGNSHVIFLYSRTYRRQAPAREQAGN